MKALLLAAGKSTRISEVAGRIPKPLLKIKGETILAHNLKLLAEHKIQEVWVNLHYQPDLIKKELGCGERWSIHLHYSFEKEILGTAGALNPIKREMQDSIILVLYGDNFTNCNLTEMIQTQRNFDGIGTLAVYDPTKTLNSAIAGGRVQLKGDGTVESFVEGETPSLSPLRRGDSPTFSPPSQGGDSRGGIFVNAGIYAFSPEILKYIPPTFSDFGRDIFPKLLQNGKKLYAYKMKNGYCLGIDTPEAYVRAQEVANSLKL